MDAHGNAKLKMDSRVHLLEHVLKHAVVELSIIIITNATMATTLMVMDAARLAPLSMDSTVIMETLCLKMISARKYVEMERISAFFGVMTGTLNLVMDAHLFVT